MIRPKNAIDTHVHFWELESYQPYASWFKERTFLAQDYLPTDLEPALIDCDVESVVIVGAAPDSLEHNRWCGELVEKYPYVGGLVGSYTFENPQLAHCLDIFAEKSWFVGIRARPASPPGEWANDPYAQQGMAILQERGLKLDMLMDHSLLPAVIPFAQKYSEVPIIINHCGLPPFRSSNFSPDNFLPDDFSQWANNIQVLASAPNVYMKYSSFYLHSHPIYDSTLFQKAADILLNAFGSTRLLWGSNWPPELVGGSYREAYELMLNYMLNATIEASVSLSQDEIDNIYRNNAQRVYGLSS